MAYKPVDPRTHGAIDYALGAYQMVGPTLFRLSPRAAAISRMLGGVQSMVNMFSDQPLAVARLMSFKQHGQMDAGLVPAIVLAPWMAGVLKEPRARAFFLGFFGVAFAHFVLTDYEANEPTDGLGSGGSTRSNPASKFRDVTQKVTDSGEETSQTSDERAATGAGEGDAGRSDQRVFPL